MDDFELRELREFVALVKGHAKSGRNQIRTLVSLLAQLEERLTQIEKRLDRARLIAQPEEAQRNGSDTARDRVA
jgi:capsule polysaccharide export protein KpsE/RkpR